MNRVTNPNTEERYIIGVIDAMQPMVNSVNVNVSKIIYFFILI